MVEDHVICPGCAHNFEAISPASRERIAELKETCEQSLAIIEEFSCTDAAFRNLSNVELGKMVIDMKLKLARVIAGLKPMSNDEFSKLLQR